MSDNVETVRLEFEGLLHNIQHGGRQSRDNVEAVRSCVRRFESIIRNCRHGAPPPNTPWILEAQMLAIWDPTPTDMLLIPSNSSTSGDDDEIITALSSTIDVIIDHQRGFHMCLRYTDSRKLFAAMAVDAWIDEDFLSARKFLTKYIILYHLQSAGATQTLQRLDNARGGASQSNRHSLLQRAKGVLQCPDQCLKTYLEWCIDGACNCVSLAQTLNDDKEILLNPSDERTFHEARREKRVDDRLPPVLKQHSRYWRLKKKAAECLQMKKLDYSMKLYLKAKAVLEQHNDFEALMHQAEWLIKIGEENGRIASNLSNVCLLQDEKQKALEYADEAVERCPNWSKSYCRRALALKSLGRLEEARGAIIITIQKCRGEVSRGEADKKRLKEYQDIQDEIQEKLASNATQGQSHSIENPLYQPLDCKPGSVEVWSIASIGSNLDIMDNIYSFLMPVDVAELECTCKRFAMDAERGRRVATASNLISNIQSFEQLEAGEGAFAKYVESVNDSPIKALQQFISEVHHMIDDDAWIEYISHVKMFPLALKTIIDTAFCNASATRVDDLFEMLDFEFDPSRDFQIARYLLRGNAPRSFKCMLLSQLNDLDDDEGIFARIFVHHSVDIEVMRLSISAVNDDNDNMYGSGMKDTALILLNNTILLKGGSRRQKMDPEDPLFHHLTAFHSLYTKLFPDEWPGLIDDSFSWKKDTIEKESIAQFWVDETPGMFPLWRLAILKSLKWVHDVEKEGCISEYLLVNRIILGEIMDNNHCPISFHSFGSFLVMKAIEYGGAVSMSVKLRTEEDLTDFFCDYYNFLNVFSAGFPLLVEYRDSVVAQHFSYMG